MITEGFAPDPSCTTLKAKLLESIFKPLIIIDGKETKDKIEDLDPDDIKSMSVLKDDSAIKKYGEKGKNGVIEITTKKN